MSLRFHSAVFGFIIVVTLFCQGCGGSDGGSGIPADFGTIITPPIANPQLASGKRFGTGFAGTGATNAVSSSSIDALNAGMTTIASGFPALGEYLPAGTVFPGTLGSASQAASVHFSSAQNCFTNPVGASPAPSDALRRAAAILAPGLSTLEARLVPVSGSASPSPQWPEFTISPGLRAQDLRITAIEGGVANGSGAFPVPVVELRGPDGAPVFSWQGSELTTDGFTQPARQRSSIGLPLSQLTLYPGDAGAPATGPYRLAVCGGPGARATLSLLTVSNPDPGQTGVKGTAIASGDVEITLWWDSRADIDLHLVEPDGTKVYYDAVYRQGRAFELTLEDNTDGTDGFGPEAMRLMPGALPDGSGTYRLFVHYYASWPANAPSGATRCLIKVKTRTETRLFSRDLSGKGAAAMVAELQFIGAGTAMITEASAGAALPWQPPQQGQQAAKRHSNK